MRKDKMMTAKKKRDDLGWKLDHPLWGSGLARGVDLQIQASDRMAGGGTLRLSGRDHYDVPWPGDKSEADDDIRTD
jgi:hypothetical protein